MKKQQLIRQYNLVAAKKMRKMRTDWSKALPFLKEHLPEEIPGEPEIDLDYDMEVVLKYPMDKAAITAHQEFFKKLGYEWNWFNSFESWCPAVTYRKEGRRFRIEYNGFKATSCVRQVVSEEEKTEVVVKRSYEWVCKDVVDVVDVVEEVADADAG